MTPPAVTPPAGAAGAQGYYGQPIVRAPVWKYDVPAYLFTGGVAAGSAVLAAGADLTGRPVLRRAGRVAALAALGASTYFLINDLGRPERFHHMLRVAKPTSPMSMGTWILTAFGAAAGLAGAAEAAPLLSTLSAPTRGRRAAGGARAAAAFAARAQPGGGAARRAARGAGRAAREARGAAAFAARALPPVGRAAGVAAGVVAPALATYTAVLIANTAIPSWHAAHGELPFVFAGSAMASGAGVGLIGAGLSRDGLAEAGPARRLAVVGAALELAGAHRVETRLGRLSEPYTTGQAGRLLRAGRALTAAGVVGAWLGRRSRLVSVASGAALLAASLATRFGIYAGGVASAEDPTYVLSE